MNRNKGTFAQSNREKGMENSHKYFENRDCKYYPCHEGIDEVNCMFCFCPMYGIEECPGKPEYIEKEGVKVKKCTGCTFPHKPENYEHIMQVLRERRKNTFQQN